MDSSVTKKLVSSKSIRKKDDSLDNTMNIFAKAFTDVNNINTLKRI